MKHGSLKQEEAYIIKIGGVPHKNSGRNTKKGDGSWHNFVIDVKHTHKSFTLNRRVWGKICSDAVSVDISKDPALIVVLDGGVELAVVAVDVLEELIERAENGTVGN